MIEAAATPAPIRILPPEIASRIAAGEVIERPASAVKELVENSLDAGASRIEISLEDGGRQLIEVADNGQGMSQEEALTAIQRHATSKITSADDLFRITSYGFRGEALPSIASVSEFELITRRRGDDAATRLLVRGGILSENGPAPGVDGTVVRVARLFENVPARQKFMKSAPTELGRSLDFVQRLALAHPEVHVCLRHGGQEHFSHTGGDDISALVSVFGRQIARELIPVTSDRSKSDERVTTGEDGLRVRAYLAPPTRTRPNRTQQFIFVNRRAIGSRTISHAVDEAYAGMLPHGRFPILVLFIEMPPEMVDVNVHPRKAEVKFLREHEVHSRVFHALRDALVEKGLVPRVSPQPAGMIPAPGEALPTFSFEPGPSALGGAARLGGEGALAEAAREIYAPYRPDEPSESTHLADQRLNPDEIRILGQVASTYIVAETREGLAIVDQHTAHERVLYERFRVRSTENPVQLLASPMTLDLSRREAIVVKERLKEFADVGFLLEEFGPDTILVRGVPAGIRPDRLEAALRDMIADVLDLMVEKKILAPREAVITSAACKAAVKAGDSMSEPEMRSLIQQLVQCENPYVCPHGRPVILKLDRASLERIFQR